jgi:diguanylate cyclase (GGDEF)-like protein
MPNSTALVFAKNSVKKNHLVECLKTTGLFQKIQAVSSIPAVFHHLKTKPADVICWVMEKTDCRYEWINRLQKNEEWYDLPLIAFAEDQQSFINSFQHGASDALSLQIDCQELSARMNCHLQRWARLNELRKTQEELQRMALTDPLTGLGNRATFDMSIKQVAARARRNSSAYSLMMIDLDHFKKINDTYGHQIGDIVLQQASAAIADAARDADVCCRYGGEEFAIILPDTSAENAKILGQRIHQYISQLPLVQAGTIKPLTVSIGISGTDQNFSLSPARLIREADLALYQAKRNGRNRTEQNNINSDFSSKSTAPTYPQLVTAHFA